MIPGLSGGFWPSPCHSYDRNWLWTSWGPCRGSKSTPHAFSSLGPPVGECRFLPPSTWCNFQPPYSWYYSGSWLLTPWLIRPGCWSTQPTLASARPTLSVTWVSTKASPGTSSPNPSWALSLAVQNQEQRFQWCWPQIQTWKVCKTTSYPKTFIQWKYCTVHCNLPSWYFAIRKCNFFFIHKAERGQGIGWVNVNQSWLTWEKKSNWLMSKNRLLRP